MHTVWEFEGGTSTNVTFDKDYSIEEIDSEIVPVIEEVTGITMYDSESSWNEAGNYQDGNTGSEGREALNQAMADEFGVDTSKITAENISSTVSNEMRRDAVVAVIIATICMLLLHLV